MTKQVKRSASSWRSRIKDTANVLLNTLFPPVCAGCSKVGSLLCQRCSARIQRLETSICPHCGQILLPPHTCVESKSPIKEVRAATRFTDPISIFIYKLKYEGQFALAAPLAKIMAEQQGTWWESKVNVVVPIPLHPDRERARGYNQSALLAQHFCRLTGFPYDLDAIQRVRHTDPQVGLSAGERRKNVAGAFWVRSERVAGKNILLIDDVYTTGATMAAAASALLDGMAASVSAYCLARAV